MRFRHPKTGELMSVDQFAETCMNPGIPCRECPIITDPRYDESLNCQMFVKRHPREAAVLLSVEVVLDPEDNETEPSKVLSEPDMVNHPPHYTQGGIECIDALTAMITPYEDPNDAALSWQVVKYIWRHPFKTNPLEDLKKAQFYLNRLIGHYEKKESTNDC